MNINNPVSITSITTDNKYIYVIVQFINLLNIEFKKYEKIYEERRLDLT